MDFKSYSRKEIRKALKDGKEIWALDTGADGEDDVLIGTWRQVEADILTFHERDEWPDHWTIREIEIIQKGLGHSLN